MMQTENDNKILSIDIGGSNIKAILLNDAADVLKKYEKLPTTRSALEAILRAISAKAVGGSASSEGATV